MTNPIKAVINIKRDELPFSLLMFSYFFLVITTFWILKPLKKTLFIGFYKEVGGFDLFSWHMKGSQAELLAKVLNMVVAFLAVVVFTWLARKFRRQQLTFVFSGFTMVCALIFSFIINNPAGSTVWSFYLFGDLFNTLMVATFFAFLNDSVTPDAAKRLYGLVVLGGVTGGAFGSTFVRVWTDRFAASSWMWICIVIAIVIAFVAMIAGKIVDRDRPKLKTEQASIPPVEKKSNVAIEGAKLVFKSPYLLAIVGIVGFYEIVSTVLDFQFTATIEHFLDTKLAIGKQIATVYSITNIVAMLVQLFFTSFIMTRFGVKTALFVLPLAILLSSCGFIAVPVIWIGCSLSISDNSLNYSVNQSSKEALYVPTSRDEKYKAKAFIDMFVHRFAKALAVGVSLGITAIFTEFSAIRWLSVFTLVIVITWIFVARYAGNKFQEITT